MIKRICKFILSLRKYSQEYHRSTTWSWFEDFATVCHQGLSNQVDINFYGIKKKLPHILNGILWKFAS